ncbi:MAG: hypothetical protein HY898_22805 [Deltaproteobacteria bacterium]|nr:hypothetical protein [Deltaproteobacteria bacterium]
MVSKIDRTLAARTWLRARLRDLVRRFPRLTTQEAQERTRTWIDSASNVNDEPGDGSGKPAAR